MGLITFVSGPSTILLICAIECLWQSSYGSCPLNGCIRTPECTSEMFLAEDRQDRRSGQLF
jgi:hypothetical protein